jgi:hypothetical protein
MVGALVAFSTTHRSWWLVPLVLFLPDLFMVGYRGGTRIGAHVLMVNLLLAEDDEAFSQSGVVRTILARWQRGTCARNRRVLYAGR